MKKPTMILISLMLLAAALSYSEKSGHRYINIPGGRITAPPFSDAVLAGNTLYLSGDIGLDRSSMTPTR